MSIDDDISPGDLGHAAHHEALAAAVNAASGTYVPLSGRDIGAQRLDPALLKKFRKAVARTRNGDADTKVLCVGDSTTIGTGVTNQATAEWVRSWPTRLVERLNAGWCPAAVGLGVPISSLSGNT